MAYVEQQAEEVRCQEVADIPQPSFPALSGSRLLADGWYKPLSLDETVPFEKSSQLCSSYIDQACLPQAGGVFFSLHSKLDICIQILE